MSERARMLAGVPSSYPAADITVHSPELFGASFRAPR
jgi:hypothetical protein